MNLALPPFASAFPALGCFLALATSLPAQTPAGTDPLGIEFVRLPAGEFLMGSGDKSGTGVIEANHYFSTIPDGPGSTYEMRFKESPAHQVRISQPFEMSTHEITVDQFRRFVEATGYATTVEAAGGILTPVPDEREGVLRFDENPAADWRSPGFDQQGNEPVVGISWQDAAAFCQWMSEQTGRTYRLPTESEWEYACRAGTDTIYSTGNDPAEVVRVANLADKSLAEVYPDAVARQRILSVAKRHDDGAVFTKPVKSFPPNPWGLHDMHGNVWEWTSDIYLEKEYQRRLAEEATGEGKDKIVVDPTGPEETPAQEYGDWRTVRGGSWLMGPVGARSAIRGFWRADSGSAYIGFRVVRE